VRLEDSLHNVCYEPSSAVRDGDILLPRDATEQRGDDLLFRPLDRGVLSAFETKLIRKSDLDDVAGLFEAADRAPPQVTLL
jgi:hypothetical protein